MPAVVLDVPAQLMQHQLHELRETLRSKSCSLLIGILVST